MRTGHGEERRAVGNQVPSRRSGHMRIRNGKKFFTKPDGYDIIPSVRGISAVGSAQHWQCWGQEFESPMLHKRPEMLKINVLRVFLFYRASPKKSAKKRAMCTVCVPDKKMCTRQAWRRASLRAPDLAAGCCANMKKAEDTRYSSATSHSFL